MCTDCRVSYSCSLTTGSLTYTTTMSDVEGLRLLANHLAKVKLEAAENRYELSRLLKITQGKNEELEGEVCRLKQLCRENSLHWRLQERDDWKALVEAVQKDRSRLERENEKLVTEISLLRQQVTSLGHVPEAPENSAYISPLKATATSPTRQEEDHGSGSRRNSCSPSIDDDPAGYIGRLEEDLGLSKRRESALREKLASLTAQLERWRIEKQSDLENQVDALRHKLDTELQAKWERSQHRGAISGLFSSLIETVAPHPTLTRRKDIMTNNMSSGEEFVKNGKEEKT